MSINNIPSCNTINLEYSSVKAQQNEKTSFYSYLASCGNAVKFVGSKVCDFVKEGFRQRKKAYEEDCNDIRACMDRKDFIAVVVRGVALPVRQVLFPFERAGNELFIGVVKREPRYDGETYVGV